MWTSLLIALFFTCAFALIHHYILYPLIACFAAKGKNPNRPKYHYSDTDLPHVTVLMSVYNEEKVLADKLANFSKINYPAHLLRIIVGSDASSDASNKILDAHQRQMQDVLEVCNFRQRRGKPPVINNLATIAEQKHPFGPNHLLLMTDASVMLEPDTLFRLATHFKDAKVGCVDANMKTEKLQNPSISSSESSYMHNEIRLKQCESIAWNSMIGPFGGCYMIRSDLFSPIPPRSLVDDFYIAFCILEKGFYAINDLEAICYERPPYRLMDEYWRKKRIATGSMKNLSIFSKHLLPPSNLLGFAFFSHKVLRWLGPWFLLGMALSSGLLALDSPNWSLVFVFGISTLCLVTLFYFISTIIRFKIPGVQHLFYFIAMNIALMHGTISYLRGIKSDIWQPTKRD
jgi:cellulose synthase/poly-beta-1,6-N-acetylglucosamine synthase-like glycosyltransferase